ncbi:MAG TPA: HNH endonuclease signature motif containing protein [Nocardioides sp.]|uniref:HNH endonuclease signature motif containing protein n=1 Tax=Nocardioides sp. TaxID=35761 RepID=UPI002E37F039|nr:HNH endonuclease signature motif containing protein [Nocardioides sp.]HEX5088674.1 HNH endonuclease signature motif containing protein [Nocardioides sp.]
MAAYLDEEIARRAETVGLVTLDRILDEAKLRLHAEERELEQLEALDARHVLLDERSMNHTGIADLVIRGDWADLKAFEEKVAEVAAALADNGCPDSVDARRSMAVGVLADPERALALVAGRPAPSPKRRVVLTYHLTDAALVGLDPVGFDVDGRPLLDQLVRQGCARDDVSLVVQPLRTLGACRGGAEPHEGHAVEDYRPNAADLLEVELRDRTCVHPYCTRPARHCDCDHVVPFEPDSPERGPTCPCNLAPLCRHHHRLKTLSGWRYTIIEPGIYLWCDPHGQRFLRTPDGTHDVTDRLA